MSTEPSGKTAVLIARAGAGIAIRILDASLAAVGAGSAEVTVELPEGLYSVEWTSAGVRTETLVKLVASRSPHVVTYNAAEIEGQSMPSAAPWPAPDLVSRVGKELRPSERSYGSSVAIITSIEKADAAPAGVNDERFRVDDAGEAAALSHDTAEVRLFTAKGKPRRANTRDLPSVTMASDDEARCYRVRPGRYSLRFRSLSGETIEQSVPALPGRQTLVFLRLASTHLLVPEGQSFARIASGGVDPARTVMISVAGDEEDVRIRERSRLAGVLLHDLAVGTGSLSSGFVAILDDDRTDPLLRLFGAFVTLARLDDKASPAIDAPWPDRADNPQAFVARWVERAAAWLGDPSTTGMPTDAIAAAWHIEQAYPGMAGLPPSMPGRIQFAPMLERAWTWAIERSVSRPDAVVGTASLTAAGRSAAGGAPWLCWKPAAATAAPAVATKGLPSDIDQLANIVRMKSGWLSEALSKSQSKPGLLDVLSPEAAATVLRVNQLASPDSRSGRESLSSDLAQALKLPSTQLKRHLISAIEEVSRALFDEETRPLRDMIERHSEEVRVSRFDAIYEAPAMSARGEGGTAESGNPARPPGLDLRILDPDDPHKGRFGGKASRSGFRARASFRRKSDDWTEIGIGVEGKARDGAQVQFYLHDSFRPDVRTKLFKHGRASIKVTAWGGFTVGIWIAETEVELELDLAELSGAPPNIRTR